MSVQPLDSTIEKMREATNVAIRHRATRRRIQMTGLLLLSCALAYPAYNYAIDTDSVNRGITHFKSLTDEEARIGADQPPPGWFGNTLDFTVNKWGVVATGNGDVLVVDYAYAGSAEDGSFSLIARWNQQPTVPATVGAQWDIDTQPWYEATAFSDPILAPDGRTMLASPISCITPGWVTDSPITQCVGTEYIPLTGENGDVRVPDGFILIRTTVEGRFAAVTFALDSAQRHWRPCNLLRCLPAAPTP